MEYETKQPTAKPGPEAKLAKKLCAQFKEARIWMEPSFEKARKARAFYDSKQFTVQQEHELEANGRPVIVINRVAKAVDNICGRERAARYDWDAKPIGTTDMQRAEFATLVLEYIDNQTEADWSISDAFEDAIKGPMGWLGAGYDDTEPGKEPVKLDTVDPFEMYFDPHSRRRDFSDCRYQIRKRIVDLDIAIEAYGKEQDLRNAIIKEDLRDKAEIAADYGNRDDGNYATGYEGWFIRDDEERERVCLREHWWWEYEDGEFLEVAEGRTLEWDPMNPEALALVQQGLQPVKKRLKRFHYAVMAGPVLLFHERSPLPFDRFPYVPVWCKRDREGRPHGLIDIMIPAQMERNVARARLNESARSRHLVYEQDALATGLTESDVAQRVGRANFILPVQRLSGVQIGSDKVDAQLWLALQEMADKEIDDVVGNNEAAYGDKSNEKSGVAIQARVMQQSMNLGKVFDNLKWARKTVGEMLLSLAQSFYPLEKWARIIEAQALSAKREVDLTWVRGPEFEQITQTRFDIAITDQADTATERQARFQQGVELAPFVADWAKPKFMADLIRMSDWPDKDETAAAIEQGPQPPPGMLPPGMAPPGAPPGLPPKSPPPGLPAMEPGLLM